MVLKKKKMCDIITIESEKFNLLYKKYNNHKTQLLECVGLAEIIGRIYIITPYSIIKTYKNKICYYP